MVFCHAAQQVLSASMPDLFQVTKNNKYSCAPESPNGREIARRNQDENAQQADSGEQREAQEPGLLCA
jgi:hypothetical protein